MPLPLLAAASLISGGISALTGASQRRKANKMIDNNPFPEQQIPQAILDNANLAKMYASRGLPSEQYQKAQRDIQRNANRAIQTATDRRGGLGMIGNIQQASNDANLNLNVADANALRQNQQRQMQQNNVLGQWQNNVWDWNKRQKYIQTAASARALLGAGNANLNQGLDRGLSGLLMGANIQNQGQSLPDYQMPTGANISNQMNQFMQNRPRIDQSLIPKNYYGLNNSDPYSY